MGYDMALLLADLMLDSDKDLPLRLEAQEEALSEIQCIDPQLGKWIDSYEVPFLVDTLTLDEEIFSAEFPSIKSLTLTQREGFAAALEQHSRTCPHCQRKVLYDMEWDQRMKSALRENEQALSEELAAETIK